ncbi:extracellular solute-binding protein [Paenibacillus radicis (ex Xue et al. 2023)]|uniref:Extracellular solute-binding protein n=1 Tax=Paenibacillus radicis (ex Xue et al. 2023) TaxID=2972489 RepID=A0ABT1YQ17_9BACL|nr:extracellular solute-binding protein [Paenibacillus radicis (ex Xue et al. 2023)]MCR8634835.1 extracellular solute-binding protein [Paenibacillus radicis (ex Xue et al. 2023)]
MKKKAIALMVCISLPGSLLAACSGKDDKKPAAVTGPITPPTVKLVMSDRNMPYVTSSPNINEDKYIKRMRELSKTDVRLEPVAQAEYSKKLNLMFASGDLPDAIQVINGIASSEVAAALNNGAFYDLNELIDKYTPDLKKKIGKSLWESSLVSKDGKIYAVPGEAPTPNNRIVYIRKDWLDKLGLQVPKTIEEYLNVLRAFRDKDPNGNGKADEIPFTGRKNFDFAYFFFGAYDVIPDGWKYENNQLVPNFIRPQMKEALKLHQQMYNEKLMDNEIFVNLPADWDSKVRGNRVGVWVHSAEGPDQWVVSMKKADPNAEILNITAPTGPDGKGGNLIGSTVNPLSAWVIPKSNKHPEHVLKYLEWFYSDDAQKFLNYGLEGDDFNMENGKVVYKPLSTKADADRDDFHIKFLRLIGPSYIHNQEYMKSRANGEYVTSALKIATSEGRINDGLDMPLPPTQVSRPELQFTGLWMETAAKIITGRDPLDSFDKFVEDWKKRGGDKAIQEATDWYKQNRMGTK